MFIYTGPIELPKGLHHVKIERGGFYAFERDAEVPQGSAVTLRVTLEPKP